MKWLICLGVLPILVLISVLLIVDFRKAASRERLGRVPGSSISDCWLGMSKSELRRRHPELRMEEFVVVDYGGLGCQVAGVPAAVTVCFHGRGVSDIMCNSVRVDEAALVEWVGEIEAHFGSVDGAQSFAPRAPWEHDWVFAGGEFEFRCVPNEGGYTAGFVLRSTP